MTDRLDIRELLLRPDLLRSIVDHMQASAPFEGCGLLAMVEPRDQVARPSMFFPGTNVDRSPVRFTMAPKEVVDAFRYMREHGLMPAAIVHSHPVSPPVPSATDLNEDYYPALLKMIVSLAPSRPEIKVWRRSGLAGAETYSEVPWNVVQGTEFAACSD